MNGVLKICVLSALVCYCTANGRHAKTEQDLKQRLVRHHGGDHPGGGDHHGGGGRPGDGGRPGGLRNSTNCYSQLSNCTFGNYTAQVVVNFTTALGNSRSPNVEAAVTFLRQINIQTLCNESLSVTGCLNASITAAPAECQQQLAPLAQSFNGTAAFVNYLCVTQLNNLQSAQQCLSYDLVGDVTCCGIKEHFSSNCSALDALNCAQQTISKQCTPAVGQAFNDTYTQVANIFANGSLNQVLPVCPGPRYHADFVTELFNFLF